jgi:hypothetical protein
LREFTEELRKKTEKRRNTRTRGKTQGATKGFDFAELNTCQIEPMLKNVILVETVEGHIQKLRGERGHS